MVQVILQIEWQCVVSLADIEYQQLPKPTETNVGDGWAKQFFGDESAELPPSKKWQKYTTPLPFLIILGEAA